LDLRRRGHDHHAITQGFTTGFIKKWNVCEEKFGRCAVLIRFNAPLPANPGMENFFERAFFSRVLEDYRADCLPIQVAIAGKNAKAENVEQLLFDLIKIDKLASDLVGIEKFGFGKNLPETLTKGAFAGGNSAGDSDCWHAVLIASVNAAPTTEKKSGPCLARAALN
jgi:hypothetical protein